MRIGINLLYLIPGIVGGTEMYARSTIQGLVKQGRHDYVLFVNKNLFAQRDKLPDIEIVELDVDARSRTLRYAAEQFLLPNVAKRARVELLHSMAYVSPLKCDFPTVVTIHDVNFRHVQMGWLKKATLPWFVRQAAKTSAAIVTVSEFSKQEICDQFGVSPTKVTVTYNAPDDDVLLGTNHSTTAAELPYFLALSSFSPHKNIRRLLEAFERVVDLYPKVSLVIAGHLPPGLSVPPHLLQKVLVTGYVSREKLLSLYRSAHGFIMPSLYEGFGIPILEAMALGTPVACSNRGSLPEVGGNAAIYFDPLDIEAMVTVMTRLVIDEGTRQCLIERGIERASMFSWNRSVDCLLEVYDAVAGNS